MKLIRRLEWPEDKDNEALLEKKIKTYAKRLSLKSKEYGHSPDIIV